MYLRDLKSLKERRESIDKSKVKINEINLERKSELAKQAIELELLKLDNEFDENIRIELEIKKE